MESRWRREWQPTPVFLPRKFHGQSSLEGCSLWGPKELDWRRKWQPTPVFLLGESHGERSLAGHSLWGRKSQTGPSDQAQHCTWNLEGWYWWTCFKSSKGDADLRTRVEEMRERVRWMESSMDAYTRTYVKSQWEFAVWLMDLKLRLYNNLDRGKLGERFKREGTYVYLWLIHVDVWQKSNQHCKAINQQK